MKLIGKSKHTLDLGKKLEKLNSNREDFILIGEAGVGKSTIAETIAKSDSFYSLLDASTLNEYELQTRLGEIQSGSLIIENIDDSNFRCQSIFLAFLGQKPTSVRLIATLREAPEELIEKRKLTEEIHARLLGMKSLEILPLRQRPEDIPHLLRHIAPDLVIDINTLELLIKRSWRENIRELKFVIERCIESSLDGDFVLPQGLVEEKTEIAKAVNGIVATADHEFNESLDALEQSILQRALNKFGLNTTKAAQFLGMSENAFKDKTHQLAMANAKNSAR